MIASLQATTVQYNIPYSKLLVYNSVQYSKARDSTVQKRTRTVKNSTEQISDVQYNEVHCSQSIVQYNKSHTRTVQ